MNRRRRNIGADAGFTLIELLVVLVIIPIIIGGVAEVLLVSFNNESATSNRISDTVNAQLTQDYFLRDVQGASEVTTLDNTNTSLFSYSSISPQVCSPGSGSLLVALYHGAEGSGPALDVAYWLEGTGTTTEIDRYSCTLTASSLSTSPAKIVIATPPPQSILGQAQTQETISVTNPAEITPTQFATAAAGGWTFTDAFTSAQGFSGTTLSVGSTSGFTTGAITVVTSSGSQTVTCTGITSATFTGCGSLTGVGNGDPVTQSSVSSVLISVTEPASSYKYSLLGTSRSVSPQNSTTGSGPPTLLTLGPDGISPVNGGGSAKCPDQTVANICIGTANTLGGVIVDSGGVVFCNGGGPHAYVWFQGGKGTVDTVAAEGSSSCSGVTVAGSAPTFPDPFTSTRKLPNNGCFAANLVSTAAGGTATTGGLALNPSSDASGNAVPGVYTNPLSGTLEPGVYVLEDGINSISGMAAPSSADPYYQVPFNSGAGNYDSTAGALFVIPGPGPYLAGHGCLPSSFFSSNAQINGSINGVVPLDSTQAADFFGGNQSLGGVWAWQDATNTNQITVVGFTQPAPGSAENGGLLYAPGADYTPPSPPAPFSTGSMIIAGTASNGTHLSLCLNWTYTSSC